MKCSKYYHVSFMHHQNMNFCLTCHYSRDRGGGVRQVEVMKI